MANCYPPTVEDLEKWLNTDIPEDKEDFAEMMLIAAYDMVMIMSGCGTDIFSIVNNPSLCRSLSYVVMELAYYLMVQADTKTEYFTPFTGEHIGSYSYNKGAELIQLAAQNKPTGIGWLDVMLPQLQTLCSTAAGRSGGPVDHVSTHIMPEAGVNRPWDFWQITDPPPTTPGMGGGGFWSSDPAGKR